MSIVVVTGPAGLIGSQAVRYFARLGHIVIGAGAGGAAVDALRADLPRGFTHEDMDLHGEPDLARIFSTYKRDVALVVHSALHDGAAFDPASGLRLTATLLEQLRLHAPEAVFIFASSRLVYGDAINALTFIESESRLAIDPAQPISAGVSESVSIDQSVHSIAGVGLAAADLLVQEYGRTFGLRAGVFRLGTVSGASRQYGEPACFLGQLTAAAIRGAEYVIPGFKAKQTRDVIHTFDVLSAFEEFFRAPRSGAVYNLGGSFESSCSTLEAIEMVQSLTQRAMNVGYLEAAPPGEPAWYISDVSRFRADYSGWSITYAVPEILVELFEQTANTRLITACHSLKQLRFELGFTKSPEHWWEYIDPDLDRDDLNRRNTDSTLLANISANVRGKQLEIGTSFGHGTYQLAANTPGPVHTVNLLPEQYDPRGLMPTHLIADTEIGSFYRSMGLKNVVQHFANTLTWDVPAEVDGLSLAFIDGDHTADVVAADSRLAYDRLLPGGYLLWHDFSLSERFKYDWVNASMSGVEQFLNTLGHAPEMYHLSNSWIGILKKPGQLSASQNRAEVLTEREEITPLGAVRRLAGREETEAAGVKSLRTVWAFGDWADSTRLLEEQFCSRMRVKGYDVTPFGLDCRERGWLPFQELDARYQRRDPGLMKMYEQLESACAGADVLIGAGGSMLHPDFIRSLRQRGVYTVFYCCDDPESSEVLSKPVASSFDCACPANIACLDDYFAWGCTNVRWAYHGFSPDVIGGISEESIRSRQQRDLEIVLLCERIYNASDRAQRIEALVKQFPNAFVRGKGWPEGRVEDLGAAYRRARIGWNLHNSIGPVNSRVIELPLYGVMQICDNKKNLGNLFTLGKEIAGFDTLQECVELTRYYLAHDDERAEIAVAGWKRARRDYTDEMMLARLILPAALARNAAAASGARISPRQINESAAL